MRGGSGHLGGGGGHEGCAWVLAMRHAWQAGDWGRACTPAAPPDDLTITT